jgi:thymidylate kinase
LDVPVEQALLRRRDHGQDRIEAEGEGFLERVRNGFQVLCQGTGWRRVDAMGDPARVTERCCQALQECFAPSVVPSALDG